MSGTPARPTEDLLERLYERKRALHAAQRTLPLPEKLRIVLELQKIVYEILRARGDDTKPLEKPWEVEP